MAKKEYSFFKFYKGEKECPFDDFFTGYCWLAEKMFYFKENTKDENIDALTLFRQNADKTLMANLPELLRAFLFSTAYHLSCKAAYDETQGQLLECAKRIYKEKLLPLFD